MAYKDRNRVERMWCRLKDFRRVATRYDKLARNYLAGAFIAAMQHGVVDLDARVLHFERHHVPKMLKLCRLFDKRAAMVDPWCNIARCVGRPCVTPAVRVDKPVLCDQHVIACGVC